MFKLKCRFNYNGAKIYNRLLDLQKAVSIINCDGHKIFNATNSSSHKKCDETKPICTNCISSGASCEGYLIRLRFDVDDSRNAKRRDRKGNDSICFVGKPTIAPRQPRQQTIPPRSTLIDKGIDVSEVESDLLKVFGVEFSALDLTITDFMDKIKDYELPQDLGEHDQILSGTYPNLGEQHETMLLKHFLEDMTPFMDAQVNTTWSTIFLKYCDFEVAKSCFISLASIHLYKMDRENNKGLDNQYFKLGICYLTNIMEIFMKRISSKSFEIDKLKHPEIILILIYTYIIFVLLESGKSHATRKLFQVFGSYSNNEAFQKTIRSDDNIRILVTVLSWFDTISAVVSSDNRVPYCNPKWYGNRDSSISTLTIMGCPGEIFGVLSKICYLKQDSSNLSIYNNFDTFHSLEGEILRYRSYVPAPLYYKNSRVACAQCWSIAAYMELCLLFKPINQELIQSLVFEFISVCSFLDSGEDIVNQMVYPIYITGCCCLRAEDKLELGKLMDKFYTVSHSGTISSLKEFLEGLWVSEYDLEEYKRRSWNGDYLPL